MDWDGEIRRVIPGDWERWRDARLAALADSPAAFGSTLKREQAFDDDVWIGRVEGAAAGDELTYFIAQNEPGGPVIGMVGTITFDTPPGECELVSMWIAPEVRQRGVGGRLVEACLAWARAVDGLDRMALWVTSGNDPAYRLYERCGFVATGEVAPLPSDPKKEELRMRCALS